MKRILSLLLGLVLMVGPIAGPLNGQRETEILVVEYVLDDVIITGPSAEIRNAGQTQHSLFVRLENRPALTCTTTGLDIQLEQGIAYQDDPDVVVWIDFGQAVTPVEYSGAIGTTIRKNTSGAIRNLRVNAIAFDTANCFLSVTYVGSTRPVALFDIGAGDGNNIAVFTSNPQCNIGDHFIFYNLTLSQFLICANGVISQVGSGGGSGEGTRIDLIMSDAVLLDNRPSNATTLLTREKTAIVGGGLEGFYLAARSNTANHVQWTFAVPSNYASTPIFRAWFLSSAVIGAWDVAAAVRCTTPGVINIWNLQPWDADNILTGITVSAAGATELMTIPLVNNDSMTANDLCQIDIEFLSAGTEFDFLRAEITYTGT